MRAETEVEFKKHNHPDENAGIHNKVKLTDLLSRLNQEKKKERKASTYTLRSLTPDRPPPAENTGTVIIIIRIL